MSKDGPIVDEVRRRRHEISAEYEHDLRKYGKHLRELEQQYSNRVVDQVTVVKSGPSTQQAGEQG